MDNNANTQEHFHLGQVGLIALTAAALIGIVTLKNGFHFFPQAPAAPKVTYSYDQVKQQVALEQAADYGPQQDNTDGQLAILDPNYKGGQVLGASTSTDNTIPPAEQIFTPEVLAGIKIKLLDTTTAENLKKYSDQVLLVESTYDANSILAALSGQDNSVLKNIPATTKKIVEGLAQIPVPKDLEEYHKLKMVYYTNLGNIASNFMGTADSGGTGIQENTTLLFSVLDRLDRIKSEISAKYQIDI